jgi:hypothetical protein
MKCKFCYTQMIPTRSLPHQVKESILYSLWECLACPYLVRQNTFDSNYTIMYLYNDSWYEITQQIDPQGESLLTIYKYHFSLEPHFSGSDEAPSMMVEGEKVLELKIDASITPQNVATKFPTLMVFS